MSLCVSWSVNKSYYGLAVQDKWRNLSVTAGGCGSREIVSLRLSPNHDTINLDNAPTTVIDAKPLAMVVEPKQVECSPGKSVARLVNKYVSELVSY
jgi:myb proto-oncogene protein